MKNWIIGILVLLVLVLGGYMIFGGSSPKEVVVDDEVTTTTGEVQNAATTTTQKNPEQTVIGKSAGGRDIVAYHYGTGSDEVLFVGGLHGGYEWNTSLLAYQVRDYLKANPTSVPSNLKVTVIPVANPDGLAKVVKDVSVEFTKIDVKGTAAVKESGRYNANGVDLNRNFDCDWQATGMWQNKKVSGGSAAFSEPESMALKSYIEANNIKSAVVYYSSAGGVYASACGNGVLPETTALMTAYANASGYKSYPKFDAYTLNGDMVNWLAGKNIPGISVLLTTHEDTEWDKNLAGLKATLARYAK